MAASDPQARELMLSTYEKLLDLPAGNEAREYLLHAIEKGGDPFEFAADRPELYFVAKRLKEFRSMLEELGWNSAESHSRLMEVVRHRLGAITEAEAKLHEAIAGGQQDEVLNFQTANYVQAVPGGRYFVGRRSDPYPSKEYWVFVYDRVTKTETKVPGYPAGRADHPVVSSDGKWVTVPVGFDMWVHELKEGKLSTPGKRIRGMHPVRKWLRGGVDWINNTSAMANPNWVVTQLPDSSTLRLYDHAKGTVRTIGGHGAFIRGYKSEEQQSWGVVKGENALVLLTPTKTGSALQYGTLDAKGKATWKTVATFPPSDNSDQRFYGPIPAGSRFAILNGHPTYDQFTVVDMKDGSVRDLTANLPAPKKVNRIEMHPNGKEAMVIYYHAVGNYYEVHWMDLESGKVTPIIKTGTDYVHLSPDGERIYLAGSIFNQKNSEFLRIVNPRNRLVP